MTDGLRQSLSGMATMAQGSLSRLFDRDTDIRAGLVGQGQVREILAQPITLSNGRYGVSVLHSSHSFTGRYEYQARWTDRPTDSKLKDHFQALPRLLGCHAEC